MKAFRWICLLLLIISVFLTACSNDSKEDSSPDQVSVQLKWLHQAQFAGFYTAEAQGFYAEENLEVTFVPGGIGIDIFEAVANEGVTFGVAGADSIITKRASGLPVVAIATTYRINPFAMVAFADSGIKSPRDFAGRKISVTNGGTYEKTQLFAMLYNVGVDPADVTLVPYTYDNTDFINGAVDVVSSFAAGSLLVLEEEIGDREIVLIWPSDYGVHFYSDTIFTTDDTIANDPDLVLRFLRATLRGHRYAIENPEKAIDASMVYADVQDREVQSDMFFASIPLIHTGEDQIGWMRQDVWQAMHDTLLEHGGLEKPVDLNTVYTLQFLEQIYK